MLTRKLAPAFAMRICLTIILSLSLVTTLVTQTACGPVETAEFVSVAGDIVDGVNLAVPIFESAGVNTTNIKKGAVIAGQLVEAFRNNQNPDALSLTISLIPVFREIASDASLIKDPKQRTLALVALSVAQIALQQIAKRLDKEIQKAGPERVARASRASRPAVDEIGEFAKAKKWRCRDSVSGQFKKMEYCKANPATTTVETY